MSLSICRIAQAGLAQHLDAVLADARRVAAELDLGLLEVERAGEGRDRPFGRMLALGEEAGRLEVRVVEQPLERAHRHRRNVGLVEGVEPFLRAAMLHQRIEHLVELAEMLGPHRAVAEARILGEVGPLDDARRTSPNAHRCRAARRCSRPWSGTDGGTC